MARKRTSRLENEAKRLRAEGKSWAEVADALSTVRKPLAARTIRRWFPAPEPEPEPEEAAAEAPGFTPDDLVELLAGMLRHQRDLVGELTDSGDLEGAQRATRLATSIAAQIHKQQKLEDDDGDVVRVTAADMAAAAERATKGLSNLAERVLAERATWPTCPTCRRPDGDFAAVAKSPLRALVERVFGRAS